jgi:hypothetical protein
MTNRELFKEAIAEAKCIREAAIINAKEALEESLTPQIKSLLAQRLAEMEEEDMSDEAIAETEELEGSFVAENDDEDAEEGEDEEGAAEKAEDESEEEDIDVGEMSVDDLKDLIRGIVGQMVDQDGDGDHDMDDHAMEKLAGDDAPETSLMASDEEEIDLDEILRELGEDVKGTRVRTTNVNPKTTSNELARVKQDLQEAVATVSKLREELQEINLLNAKLLYINKLFKTGKALSESQKANIITTFDKATTVKEAQLVFESLKQAVSTRQAAPIRESKLGIASAPAAARPTKKPEIIAEVSDAVKRMQKLAGIII